MEIDPEMVISLLSVFQLVSPDFFVILQSPLNFKLSMRSALLKTIPVFAVPAVLMFIVLLMVLELLSISSQESAVKFKDISNG